MTLVLVGGLKNRFHKLRFDQAPAKFLEIHGLQHTRLQMQKTEEEKLAHGAISWEDTAKLLDCIPL